MSKPALAHYRPHVSDRSASAWSEGAEARGWVPLFALAAAVVAAVADPGSGADLLLAAIPVAAFALWAYVPSVPLPALAAAIVVPVVLAQRSGALEPLLFDASLLAFVAARWSRTTVMAAVVGLLAAASPPVAALIQDPPEVNVGVWLLGIAFPWIVGRALVGRAAVGSAARCHPARAQRAGSLRGAASHRPRCP